MNARSLAALILLNAVLLAALVVTAFSPQPAQAQFGGTEQYLMIAGDIDTRNARQRQAIYIVNQRTSQIVATTYNSATDTFNWYGGRNIGNDLRGGGAGR